VYKNNYSPNFLQLQVSVRSLVSRTSAQGATKLYTLVSADIQTLKFTKNGFVQGHVCSAVPGHTLAFCCGRLMLTEGPVFPVCFS